MLRPCLDCGRLAYASRCRICKTKRDKTNPYWTPEWRQPSFEVIRRDGACVQCGGRWLLSAHHIIPRAEGGPDTLENCVALCVRCPGRESAAERGA